MKRIGRLSGMSNNRRFYSAVVDDKGIFQGFIIIEDDLISYRRNQRAKRNVLIRLDAKAAELGYDLYGRVIVINPMVENRERIREMIGQ